LTHLDGFVLSVFHPPESKKDERKRERERERGGGGTSSEDNKGGRSK